MFLDNGYPEFGICEHGTSTDGEICQTQYIEIDIKDEDIAKTIKVWIKEKQE